MEAVYDVLKDGKMVDEVTMKFDKLHVVPPMSAPNFIEHNPLAMAGNPLGWIVVDQYWMQLVRYPNIFSLGDAGSTPNSKTGATIRKQAPVVVKNILSLLKSKTLARENAYNGYGSCPLVTGYGKLILPRKFVVFL